MDIDLKKLRAIVEEDGKYQFAQETLAAMSPSNLPYLTDLYVNSEKGGEYFLVVISEMDQKARMVGRQPPMWRLQVIRDEWGNVPSPGDVVERRIPINRKDRQGKPVLSSELNAAKMDGSYEERFEEVEQYVVDEKGCISVPFNTAGYWLTNNGIHGRTRKGICRRPEHSTEPVNAPNGQKLHVWYWRFAEMDNEMYAALPIRSASDRKRGKE